jgi:DivIVA domain-containing protein
MTADDITSQRFARQFLFGLNSEEVSAFLQDVAEAYEELQRRNRVLAASVKALQSDIDPLIAKETHTAEEADTICDAAAQADSMIKAASDKETPTKPIAVLRAVALQEVEELLHDARIEAQALSIARVNEKRRRSGTSKPQRLESAKRLTTS